MYGRSIKITLEHLKHAKIFNCEILHLLIRLQLLRPLLLEPLFKNLSLELHVNSLGGGSEILALLSFYNRVPLFNCMDHHIFVEGGLLLILILAFTFTLLLIILLIIL